MNENNSSPAKNDAKEQKIIKAAKIMLVLGEDHAAAVLRHFDDATIELIMAQAAQIPKIEPEEKEHLLKEFLATVQTLENNEYGGVDKARKYLETAFGEKKASEHIERIAGALDLQDFKELETFSPKTVAQVLKNEMAQTSAMILAVSSPSFAAKVLQEIDNALRVEISRKIASMKKVSPDILKTAYDKIIDKLRHFDEGALEAIEGEERLVEILNHMDRSSEDILLEALNPEDPEMVERLRDKVRLFEEIIQLNKNEVRRLMEKTREARLWGTALKGAGQELIRHILSSVSINRAADIKDEIDALEAVPLREIENARREIMNAVDALESEGVLVLRKDREKLVE